VVATLFRSTIPGFFLLAFVLCSEGQAQTEAELFTAKNMVFAEAGGNAVRYAASYGRIFHQKGMLKLSGSAGFSMWYFNTSERYYNTSRTTYWLPAFPLEISAFLGRSKHHLEIGTGITPNLAVTARRDPSTSRFRDKVALGANVPIRVGYRYQKPEGGFFFRVGYTPSFWLRGSEGNIMFDPIWAGISLGMSF
jgi:hypothetical protein